MTLAPVVAIFAIFYFFVIYPSRNKHFEFHEWWSVQKKRRQEKREAQRLRDQEKLVAQRLEEEEFQRTHERCPICMRSIPRNLAACPLCGAPFRDAAALQTWKLQQEVAELRKQAAAGRERDKEEKKGKRGNMQGCGCLLMVAAIAFPPLFIVGLIVLIIGFCL